MEMGLKNRVALVGGASKGLGKAIAEALAEEGAKLAVCARNIHQLTCTAKEIESFTGCDVLALPIDLTQQREAERFVSAVIRRFGRIDILVNNCGGPREGCALELAPEDWKNAFELVFMSAIHLSLAVIPHMRRRKWGRIINVSSASAAEPVDEFVLSDSMHAARMVFFKGLARELAKQNILVSSVSAGYMNTELIQRAINRQSAKSGRKKSEVRLSWETDVPLRRFGNPREFASVVTFLASDKASYLTGCSIRVDGGFSVGAF